MRVPGISEAQRNAESLFESHTVVEIREVSRTAFQDVMCRANFQDVSFNGRMHTMQVETRTAVDIEEKKKQLRQLVGGSYRLLLDPALSQCYNLGPLHNAIMLRAGFRRTAPL